MAAEQSLHSPPQPSPPPGSEGNPSQSGSVGGLGKSICAQYWREMWKLDWPIESSLPVGGDVTFLPTLGLLPTCIGISAHMHTSIFWSAHSSLWHCLRMVAVVACIRGSIPRQGPQICRFNNSLRMQLREISQQRVTGQPVQVSHPLELFVEVDKEREHPIPLGLPGHSFRPGL